MPLSHHYPSMTNPNNILTLADQCVKCGLCLPQCPTYSLGLNENESPRGRISLIQAMANKQLAANESLISHLDHCLQCRRCERICPSQVKYGEILSAAYQAIPELKRQTSFTGKLGLFLLETPLRLTLLRKLIQIYQSTGLQFLVRKSGILNLFKLATMEQRLPVVTNISVSPVAPLRSTKQVALFTGCSQTLFDTEVIHSTIKLLNMLGISVVIPEQQNCCGALHKLQGEHKEKASLITNNINTFEAQSIDTVLYLSTGCGAFISEYYKSSVSFQEITSFINNAGIDKLTFKPLTKTVAVHIPCSQKNVLLQPDITSKLLGHIPGIKLTSLEQQGCCGAGATTMLKYPQMADQIRQPLLEKIKQTNSEMVVTTNPGCQLHMQHGFNTENSEIKVIHPVTLLVRQLAD